MPATATKDVRIDIRTTTSAKLLLQQAAAAQHKNVSEFLVENGLRAAESALADRRLFALDDKQWKKFQAALDAPVKNRRRLRRLLTKPGVFD